MQPLVLLDSTTQQRTKIVHHAQRILQALGVSRLARLTSLDRTGVEVVAAIRPEGHVLQVSNGKGETFEQAAQGALMEAAELVFSERVLPDEAFLRSADDLYAQWGPASVLGPRDWNGGDLLQSDTLWQPGVSLAWTPGVDLRTGRRLNVPACLVRCPPGDARWLGPLPLRWTTNGLAAHRTKAGAVKHALYELIERDTLARAFPEGLTFERVAQTSLSQRELEQWAPTAAAWQQRMDEKQLSLTFLDASPYGLTELCVAAAILIDEEGGPIPITAGYACGESLDEAACRAFYEAAQSRLTDIQGAREDVDAMESSDVDVLRRAVAEASRRKRRKRFHPTASKAPRGQGGRGVRQALQELRRHGIGRVALVHEPLLPGIHVARIIAPGLLLSGLL